MNIYPSEVVEQTGTHNIIVCEENKRVFRLENKSKRFIQKVKVDGGLIKEGIRCDYAVDANENSSSDSSSDKIYCKKTSDYK